MSAYAWLAALTVLAHMAFVLFAAAGSLLALRWRRVAWAQIPAAAWAAYVEFSGGTCPLTPLENELRRQGGLDAYSADFVARYLFPVLYPEGLTREAQMVLGAAIVCLNVAIYWRIARGGGGGALPASHSQAPGAARRAE